FLCYFAPDICSLKPMAQEPRTWRAGGDLSSRRWLTTQARAGMADWPRSGRGFCFACRFHRHPFHFRYERSLPNDVLAPCGSRSNSSTLSTVRNGPHLPMRGARVLFFPSTEAFSESDLIGRFFAIASPATTRGPRRSEPRWPVCRINIEVTRARGRNRERQLGSLRELEQLLLGHAQ